jgi:hypothetical protein
MAHPEQYRDKKTGEQTYYWEGVKIVDWKATEKDQETLI